MDTTSKPSDDATQEDGVALVTVMLASLMIGAIVAIMVSSAVFELGVTSQARDYEAAIHTAEAGIEAAFGAVLAAEEIPAIDWQGPDPGTDPVGERSEALRQVSEHGADLIQVTEGPGVGYAIGPLIADDGSVYLYGVAEVANTEARTPHRVVRTRLDNVGSDGGDGTVGGGPVVFGDFAMLIGGDLTMTDNVTQMTGAIHANGDISVRQSMGSALTNGEPHRPISATGSIECVNSWCPWFRPTPWSSQPEVPQFPAAQPADIPQLLARDVHRRYAYEIASGHGAWFDLCPPAAGRPHPSVYRPDTAGAAPCTGERISEITGLWPTATFHGWQYRSVDGIMTFTKTSGDGGYPPSGVYYAHESNIRTGDLWSSNHRITLLASADPDDNADGFGARSGNIIWRGSSWNLYYEQVAGFELALFADRDIEGDTGLGRAEGVVYAREQVRMSGNSQVWGQVIAAGAPLGPIADGITSSPGSPLDAGGGTWSGTVRIDARNYGFEVDPGDDGQPPGPGDGAPNELWVIDWQEL